MEKLKIETMDGFLDFLKEKLLYNVNKIKINSILSRELLAQDEYTSDLEEIRALNKSILSENKEILHIQLLIKNYRSQYLHDLIKFQKEKEFENKSISDWFELTINGLVELDKDHPFINNTLFLHDIMLYFQKNENYEKCQEIFDMINKVEPS